MPSTNPNKVFTSGTTQEVLSFEKTVVVIMSNRCKLIIGETGIGKPLFSEQQDSVSLMHFRLYEIDIYDAMCKCDHFRREHVMSQGKCAKCLCRNFMWDKKEVYLREVIPMKFIYHENDNYAEVKTSDGGMSIMNKFAPNLVPRARVEQPKVETLQTQKV